jgi:hypothetical protein
MENWESVLKIFYKWKSTNPEEKSVSHTDVKFSEKNRKISSVPSFQIV